MIAARKKPNLDRAIASLIKLLPHCVDSHVSMQSRTTFRCPGTVAALVFPRDKDELKKICSWAGDHQLQWGKDWGVIGRGSNLLVRDGGFPGALIDLEKGFSGIEKSGEAEGVVEVRAEGGVRNGTLLQWLRDRNLCGFGFAFGIPGSLGGGIRMNAGTPLGTFSDVVTRIGGIRTTGESVEFDVTRDDFGYRDCPEAHDLLVTTGWFRFSCGDADGVEKEIEEAKKRRVNQPLDLPNIGSVYKNPPADFAGRLIEAAGLKGFRIGDAEVSKLHANFIVNRGQATTRDAMEVVKRVQAVVYERLGVELEPEVHVIGVDG